MFIRKVLIVDFSIFLSFKWTFNLEEIYLSSGRDGVCCL